MDQGGYAAEARSGMGLRPFARAPGEGSEGYAGYFGEAAEPEGVLILSGPGAGERFGPGQARLEWEAACALLEWIARLPPGSLQAGQWAKSGTGRMYFVDGGAAAQAAWKPFGAEGGLALVPAPFAGQGAGR